ncbi:MAG: hypothetical protein U0821_18910 [Chloroflexota bacterium]
MDDVFEETLSLCLDRIADGDDPEDCAAEFAEFPQLLSLLELAVDISAIPGRKSPRPPSARQLRERLNGATASTASAAED